MLPVPVTLQSTAPHTPMHMGVVACMLQVVVVEGPGWVINEAAYRAHKESYDIKDERSERKCHETAGCQSSRLAGGRSVVCDIAAKGQGSLCTVHHSGVDVFVVVHHTPALLLQAATS